MITVRETAARSILSKTRVPAGDFVCNPYGGCPHGCIYCYAEFMRRFSGRAGPWGSFLDVKICGKKPDARRLAGKKIIFSSVTDPYNPFEKKYRVTRNILEQFSDSDVEIIILSKSDLLLRDIDLFKKIPKITAGVSLCTLDDGIRKKLEPRASGVAARLAAVKTLRDEGIRNYIFLSPVFPGITDFRTILETAGPYTGAFWFENLNLRGAYRPRVLRYIAENHPGLVPLYDEIYRKKKSDYWHALEKDITAYCEENHIEWKNYFYHEKIRKAQGRPVPH